MYRLFARNRACLGYSAVETAELKSFCMDLESSGQEEMI